jgi:hypothetical protein
MSRILLSLFSLLVACSSDVAGADLTDAGIADATGADAPGLPADAGPYCHHVTHGLILGDSIPRDMYVNGLGVLQVNGDKVALGAVGGATVGDQFANWRTSYARGSDDLDWIYLQAGINDIIHGNITVEATVSTMAAFLEDIHTANPHTLVFLGAMGPARSRLDIITGVSRYPMWIAVQGGYAALDAMPGISDALNDGMDNLLLSCDSGDHLHPLPACDKSSAAILRTWVDFAFPDIPCAP